MTTTTEAEEKTDKTEQKDRDLPLAELVAKVGAGVLGNPFLSAFISAAPSPKAADDEMVRLGWPNELARRVRLGVHLYNRCRQHGKNLWGEMTKVTSRIADQMFEFHWQPEGLQFESQIIVKWSSMFKFDTFKVEQERPLFLREMRLDSMKWSKYHFRTSVDGTGLGEYDWQNGFDVVHDLFDPDEHELNAFGDVGKGFRGTTTNGRVLTINTSHDAKSAFLMIQSGEERSNIINLRTKTVMLGTNKGRISPRDFPSLYKVLEITKESGDGEERVNEKIRVLLRQDFGPKIRHDSFMNEWVTYESKVTVSEKVEVLLEARYQVFPNARFPGHLHRIDRDAEPVRVRMVHSGLRTEESHLTDVKIGQTVQKFCGLAGRLFSCLSVEVPLERVAGLSLATNPPKELVDLFVPEPEVAKT